MEVPDYIQQEIEKYIYEKKHNIKRITTYEKIIAFIGLAKVNGRITEEEAKKIIEEVNKI